MPPTPGSEDAGAVRDAQRRVRRQSTREMRSRRSRYSREDDGAARATGARPRWLVSVELYAPCHYEAAQQGVSVRSVGRPGSCSGRRSDRRTGFSGGLRFSRDAGVQRWQCGSAEAAGRSGASERRSDEAGRDGGRDWWTQLSLRCRSRTAVVFDHALACCTGRTDPARLVEVSCAWCSKSK